MTNTTSTEYRIFDLPTHGRVRAPAHMTKEELLAALAASTDAADVANT